MMPATEYRIDHDKLRRVAIGAIISLPVVPTVIGVTWQLITGRATDEFIGNVVLWWGWVALSVVAFYFIHLIWLGTSPLGRILIAATWVAAVAFVFCYSGWEAAITVGVTSIIAFGLAFAWSRSVAILLKLNLFNRIFLLICSLLFLFKICIAIVLTVNHSGDGAGWQAMRSGNWILSLFVMVGLCAIIVSNSVKAYRVAGEIVANAL